MAVGAPFTDYRCIEILSVEEKHRFLPLDGSSQRSIFKERFLSERANENIRRFNSTYKLDLSESSQNDKLVEACKTLYAVTIKDAGTGKTVFECRKGLRNEVQGLKNLARTNAGEECKLLINDDAIDPDKESKSVEYSLCGFNVNSNSFCDIQSGDDYFIGVLKGFADKVYSSGIECHIDSDTCYLFWHLLKSKEIIRLINLLMIVEIHYAYVADNDKCVAEAVTGMLWQGTFGDDAYSLMLYTPLIFASVIFTLW